MPSSSKHAPAQSMMKDRTALLLLASLHCFVCCGGDIAADTTGGVTTGTGGGVQTVPANHRSASTACPEQRGAGNANNYTEVPGDECTQDSDCTAGMNGRCLWFHGSHCSYDACFSDSDCPNNEPCQCRQSVADSVANFCVGGNCRVDADCGQGAFCSPSRVGDICGYDTSVSASGYFCHTPQDSCVDDSNCDSSFICAYSSQSPHWTCVARSGCF